MCVIHPSLSHGVLASIMGRVNVRCLCPIETFAITKTVMRSMGLEREAAYAPWDRSGLDRSAFSVPQERHLEVRRSVEASALALLEMPLFEEEQTS